MLFGQGKLWHHVTARVRSTLVPTLRLDHWRTYRGAWRGVVTGEAQASQLRLCLWPSGLIGVIAWSGGSCISMASQLAPALCDDTSTSDPMPERVEALIKLRGVLSLLKNTKDLDVDTFIDAGRSAYRSAIGKDGRLNQEGLEQMLSRTAEQRKTFAGIPLPWAKAAPATTVYACELAPILLQLLDADGDGNISEKEYLMGQALMFAAAKAQTPEVLTELCWKALDSDGDGMLSRDEVEAAVRLMVRVNAVRPQDRREKYAEIKRARGPKRGIFRDRSVDDLVKHYMDMYDANKDGSISKAEFCQHSALHENFHLMLTSPEFEPIFQGSVKSR